MQGYNFTERVRKVLAITREEAGRLKHEYVGTEHMLLGLIREGDGVAATVLRNLRVDLDEVRRTVEGLVKKGKADPPLGPDLPYTSRAKKVLELAMGEARELNHSYVGTEHLLARLACRGKGCRCAGAVRVRRDARGARAETLRLVGSPGPEAERVGPSEVERLRPVGFKLHVQYEGGYWYEGRFERAADAIAFLQQLPRT